MGKDRGLPIYMYNFTINWTWLVVWYAEGGGGVQKEIKECIILININWQ